MKILITGMAGFIGSHLAARVRADGHDVVGIDCFTDYYDRSVKESNIAGLLSDPGVAFLEQDLVTMELTPVLKNVEVIYHLAAQAGVRASWGDNFKIYTDYNVLATQRLLEAARDSGVQRVVYASSSSVYGDVDSFPMKESDYPRPVSPYGVSKLAGENLCVLYYKNYGLSTVSLRYFTVYGPRQRPDMAFHKIGRCLITGTCFAMFGSGDQTRDFTYVSDAVEATYQAAWADNADGRVMNIGGGSRISLNDAVGIMETITGKNLVVDRGSVQKGDVRHTAADTSLAFRILDYQPRFSLEEGLKNELKWLETVYAR